MICVLIFENKPTDPRPLSVSIATNQPYFLIQLLSDIKPGL